MLSVLIVDDEFLAFNYLKSLINWPEQGFFLLGQAANGLEALDLIRNQKPDIVFLDISMPKMDGIELLRVINEQYQNIVVVVLSSYSDYDYVREAMKLGAYDYMLKHRLTADKLITLLDSLKEKYFSLPGISQPNRPTGAETASLEKAAASPGLEQEVRAFAAGQSSYLPPGLRQIEQMIVVLAQLSFLYKGSVSQQEPLLSEHLVQTALTTCQQLLSDEYNAYANHMTENTLLFIFPAQFGESCSMQKERVNTRMDIIYHALIKYHNSFITYAISQCSKNILQLPDLYQDVQKNLLHQETLTDHMLNFNRQHNLMQLSNEQEKQIMDSVISRDYKKLSQLIRDVFLAAGDDKLPSQQLNILAGDFHTLLLKLSDLANVSYSPAGADIKGQQNGYNPPVVFFYA